MRTASKLVLFKSTTKLGRSAPRLIARSIERDPSVGELGKPDDNNDDESKLQRMKSVVKNLNIEEIEIEGYRVTGGRRCM